MKKTGKEVYSMWISAREEAAFGRPLPHSYPYVDSFVHLSMELRATALYRHSQGDATALYVCTQLYFMLRPALMGPAMGCPPIPSSRYLVWGPHP